METVNKTILGVGSLILGIFIFSLQDIAVKWMGGNYPVLEIVTFRSLIALPLTLLFFRYEGGRGLPTTQQPRLETIRGLFYFLSYTTHFMGLAALPLAEIAAIKFSAPLMITFLSVVILGETVGPRRWVALFVGFMGVLLIVRPGATFNMGSLFILISVLFYALATMLTRKLQTTDSSATMSYYSSLVYLVATFVLAPLVILVGEFPAVHLNGAHPSIAFLFRSWAMPTLLDGIIMSGLGLIWAGGMYFLARAYSLALASVVAPFEYVALPINVMWGFIIWQELPTFLTWTGAFLTLSSGAYILYRDQKERSEKATQSRKNVIPVDGHEEAHL